MNSRVLFVHQHFERIFTQLLLWTTLTTTLVLQQPRTVFMAQVFLYFSLETVLSLEIVIFQLLLMTLPVNLKPSTHYLNHIQSFLQLYSQTEPTIPETNAELLLDTSSDTGTKQEFEWLGHVEKAVADTYDGRLNSSWSAFHADRETQKDILPSLTALVPLF